MRTPIRIEADTAAEASLIYSEMRDESGKGGSEFPDGVWGNYHISYNGKVWTSPDSWETEGPIYNPYATTE